MSTQLTPWCPNLPRSSSIEIHLSLSPECENERLRFGPDCEDGRLRLRSQGKWYFTVYYVN